MTDQITAQNRVMETPELLETILARLPLRDLLLAQRIARRFQQTIITSPLLQTLLFFRSSPMKGSGTWHINQLLREQFLPWFVTPVTRFGMPEYQHIELLVELGNDKKREAVLRKEASWRRMLLVQPSAPEWDVVVYEHGQCLDHVSKLTLPCEKVSSQSQSQSPATMGVIYDLTESFLRGERVASFGLSILDSETGPRITLHLMVTQQCCIDEYEQKGDLRSEGAEMQYHDLYPQFKPLLDESGRPVTIDLPWEPDESFDGYGVSHVELEKWTKLHPQHKRSI